MREPTGFGKAVAFLRDVSVVQDAAIAHDQAAVAESGLPSSHDESLMFLEAMLGPGSFGASVSSASPFDRGARPCLVLLGSTLFTCAIGTAESEVQRTIIEHDWLEGVVSLPDHLFESGGVGADVWVLAFDKIRERRGSVAFVDAREVRPQLRAVSGAARVALAREAVVEITYLFREAEDMRQDPRVHVQSNESLGYLVLTVDRPLRRNWKLDESTLDGVATSTKWRELIAHQKPVSDVDPLAFFYDLIGNRRHHIPITWSTASSCSRDLRGDMGGNASAEVARILVAAAATTAVDALPVAGTNGDPYESDPGLRILRQVPLPAGFLSMSPLGQREAKTRAARKFVKGAVGIQADAWIDDAKTRVGYAVPSLRGSAPKIPA